MTISQTLLWRPHAKQRPRTTMRSGHAVTYTPEATRNAEKNIREQWRAEELDGPLAVTLVLADDTVEVTIEEVDEHTQRKLRGDIDNYAKTILDALNGVAWIDDKQITCLLVVKK